DRIECVGLVVRIQHFALRHYRVGSDGQRQRSQGESRPATRGEGSVHESPLLAVLTRTARFFAPAAWGKQERRGAGEVTDAQPRDRPPQSGMSSRAGLRADE